MNRHSRKKSLRKRWRDLRRIIVRKLQQFGSVVLYPVKLLFLPFKALNVFHDVGVQVEHSGRRSKKGRSNATVRALSRILFFPAKLVRPAFRKKKRKELVFLIPVFVLIMFFGFVAYRINFRAASIENEYVKGAIRARNNGDFRLAKSYFERVLEKKELSNPNMLNWTVILAENGQNEAAQRILDQLAPDDQDGYGPAHGVKAINLAFRVDQSNIEPPDLDRLQWHLENSGEPTEDLKRAWEIYLNARQLPDKAKQLHQNPIIEWSEVRVLIANILASSSEDAATLLNQLAINDRVGYEPAHAIKAIALANWYEQSQLEAPNLDHLQWHLEHSDDLNPDLCRAWATYSLAREEPKRAIEFLFRAAPEFPEAYVQIAQIGEANGLNAERDRAIGIAKSKFSREIQNNPLDFDSRFSLMTVLVKEREYAFAEAILIDGLRLQQAPGLKHATSVFYVSEFDRNSKTNLERRLRLLNRAIEVDIDSILPYQRLVDLMTASTFDISVLKAEMEVLVTGNNASAMDHCIMARALMLTGNPKKALWHLDQAWLLDADFGRMANNLAKAFAFHPQTPDLDWALQLATKTAANAPHQPGYRDTLGCILLTKKKFREAASEFETALADGGDQRGLHIKLAIAFDEMGMNEQALIHARTATEIPVEPADATTSEVAQTE